jgi:Xaa-Pro aminopeptidase
LGVHGLDKISKIMEAVSGSGFDAVAAFGADNITNLTGAVLPFPENYPDRHAAAIMGTDGLGTVIVPVDWAEAVRSQNWSGKIKTYDENQAPTPHAFVKAFSEAVKEMEAKRIGYDSGRISVGLYDVLKVSCDIMEPDDGLLGELRAVKTPEEVKLIETACLQNDRGTVHALNHLEGTVTYPGYWIPEFAERIRVHLFETGGSGVGHLSVTFGADTRLYYTPHRGMFKANELFRADVTSHYKGYWSNLGRMCYTGWPEKQLEDSYKINRRLKTLAESELRIGAVCGEVHDKVKKFAEWQGSPLKDDEILGHGVGTSHFEPPYISEGSKDILKEGMVVALDVITYGPRKELIHDKDVYLIGQDGARKLSWYRDWDRIYPVTGFRAFH